jgi:organic hydroperoxide reductase OsmC/OhrA
MAAAKVMSGEADMAIGGGVESMSRVPMGSDGGAWPTDPSSAFKTYFAPQGIGADLIATLYGFSRDDVDAYAVESQKRAARAWEEGRFKKSVIGVKDQMGLTILDRDEHLRPDATMQSLASLSACHMLWFLHIARDEDFVVASYRDDAEGVMAKNAEGRWAMTKVTLRPYIVFKGNQPSAAALDELHHRAHEECYIANSVRSEVTVEPQQAPGGV